MAGAGAGKVLIYNDVYWQVTIVIRITRDDYCRSNLSYEHVNGDEIIAYRIDNRMKKMK